MGTAGYRSHMDLAAYLGTVTALVTLSLGAFYFLTTQLGGRLDRQDTRFDRLDEKVDRLYDAVAQTGARITAIEQRLD
jgi:hypothetical protein